MTLHGLASLPAGPQRDLVTRAKAVLRDDSRVAAAWIVGSIARGDSDRWSDVDLYVSVPDDEFDAFAYDDPVLESIRPVLGIERRTFGRDAHRLVLFDGPVRADITTVTPARVENSPFQPAIFLVDNDGSAARLAARPVPPEPDPATLLLRLNDQVRVDLANLQQAIARRAVIAAFGAQARLLRAAERMLLALHDPRAAGDPSAKAAANALRGQDATRLIEPLKSWSSAWPDPRLDSVAPTVELLSALAARCQAAFGVRLDITPGQATPRRAAQAPISERVRDIFNLLLHAVVEAAYVRRGLFTGALWGWSLVASHTAELAYAAAADDRQVIPPDVESELRPRDREALAHAIRLARAAQAPDLRAAGSAIWAQFARAGRAAASRHRLTYPGELERAVFQYLVSEHALDPSVLEDSGGPTAAR